MALILLLTKLFHLLLLKALFLEFLVVLLASALVAFELILLIIRTLDGWGL